MQASIHVTRETLNCAKLDVHEIQMDMFTESWVIYREKNSIHLKQNLSI